MSVGDISEREERPAYVTFEQRPIEDKEESLKQGRSISKDVDWILVNKPYSRDVFEQKAKTWLDKQERQVKEGRINPKFLDYWKGAYKNWKEGLEAPVNGTDIRNWSLISPAEIKNLLGIGVKTIEDLAQANDEGVRRIGMGGMTLKNKAKAYLKSSTDHGSVVLENAEQKKKIGQLEGSLESLQDQVKALMLQLDSQQRGAVSEGYVAPINHAAIAASDIIDDSFELEKATEKDTLVKEYIAKFGKKPHWNLSEDKLRKQLAE